MKIEFDSEKEYGEDTVVYSDGEISDEEMVAIFRDSIDYIIPRFWQKSLDIVVIYKTKVKGGHKFHWRYIPVMEGKSNDETMDILCNGTIRIPGKILYSNQPTVSFLDGTYAKMVAERPEKRWKAKAS